MPRRIVRQTVLLIAGMRGNGCREKIAAALGAVAGVRSVDVNLYRARATIVHDGTCDTSQLFRATLNTGYNVSIPEEATEGVQNDANSGPEQSDQPARPKRTA